VQEQLGQWRALPPEEIGIAVKGNGEGVAVLSFWLVEFATSKGERKIAVMPIAVKPDGSRMPSIECQGESFFQLPPAFPILNHEQRTALFTDHVETSLQRELRHKGMANGDGSYAAELIGWIEIV
jgi:hypothetical protein